MSDPRNRVRTELLGVHERLEADRPSATALELDRIKLRAIRGVRRRSTSRAGRRPLARSRRLVSVALAAVLVTGGGAVFANSGGPSSGATSNRSSNSQYCPPSSPAAGKPKKPGPAKCGHGDEKDGKKH